MQINVVTAKKIRGALMSEQTQIALTDAIIGMAETGVSIGRKYDLISENERKIFMHDLATYDGCTDISRSSKILKEKYEIARFRGYSKTNLIGVLFEAEKNAAKKRVSRKEQNLIKDFKHRYQELENLINVLVQVRHVFAHNMSERQDMGWNTLILSSILRVLERAQFKTKTKDDIEKRADLKSSCLTILSEITEPQNLSDPNSTDNPDNRGLQAGDTLLDSKINTLSSEVKGLSELLIKISAEPTDSMMTANIDSTPIKTELSEIKDLINSLSDSILNSSQNKRVKDGPIQTAENKVLLCLEAIRKSLDYNAKSNELAFIELLTALRDSPPSKSVSVSAPTNIELEADSRHSDKEPIDNYAATTREVESIDNELLSPDGLSHRLLDLRDKIKQHFQDKGYIGPASNLLQRPIINLIIAEEVSDIKAALNIEGVEVRYKIHKRFMNQQINVFGCEINNLLERTTWSKDFQL